MVLGLAACETGTGTDEVAGGPGGLGVVVSALSDCSGESGKDPFAEIRRVRVDVTGPDRDTGKLVELASANKTVSGGSASITLGGIPAGAGRNVTILGYAAGAPDTQPTWFGRHRQIQITQDRVNTVDLVMARYSNFTCVTAPTSYPASLFPAVVRLGDGRVLITGGFTKATDAGSGKYVLENPTDVAVLYDPATGQVSQTANTMTSRRAGHAAVYLPLADGEKVLIVGGVKTMALKDDGTFPFDLSIADALNSYEIFDVKTGTFEAAGSDKNGHPKQMLVNRAFPVAARLFDNTVLIAGGGKWPVDSAEYLKAEIWAPAADEKTGILMDLGPALPVMNAQHNGLAAVKLEDTKEGLSRFLFVGGTTDAKNMVEVYTQSSRQSDGVSGVFATLTASGVPALYFPSITALNNRQFLVLGGVPYSGGKFQAPTAEAYLLKIGANDAVEVKKFATAACSGRFFHSASPTYEGDAAVILGGFKDFTGKAAGDACFFRLADVDKEPFSALAAGQKPFLSRAGHRVEGLIDDTLLVVGGMTGRDTLSGSHPGMIEVYAPPTLKLDLAAD
jgi:hypothetical protein